MFIISDFQMNNSKNLSWSKGFQRQKLQKVTEHFSLMCWTYSKDWFIFYTVNSTSYKAKYLCTHDCSSTLHTPDIMSHATAVFDQGLCQKLVPLFFWICLSSVLRLMLQTSQQTYFCYDEYNYEWCLWGFVLYSGPSVIKFINFTLENTVLYLIWEDSTGLLERPLYSVWKWLKSIGGFMPLFDKVS